MDALLFRLIDLAARLVPSASRADWTREWKAEAAYRRAALESRGRLDLVARVDLLLRVLGTAPDALAVRRIALGRGDPSIDRTIFAASPVRATAATLTLAVAAAALTIGFAVASAVEGPVPRLLAAAAATVGVLLARSAARAAAGVVAGAPPPIVHPLRPRLARMDVAAPREGDAAALALAGSAAGLAISYLIVINPPTAGAATLLAGGLGPQHLAFHAAASLALGALLHARIRAPAG